MEITLLKNDAFRVLLEVTGMTTMELEKRIFDTMVKEELIELDDFDLVNKSVWEIFNEIDCNTIWVKGLLFNDIETNENIFELLKSIYFFGDGTNHPCEECGCEMIEERDGCNGKYWSEWECENPYCDNKETDEPDWDTMKGGHDWDD